MIAQDQAEVVAFLSAPHGRGADKVEIIETHISLMFVCKLVGHDFFLPALTTKAHA